MKNSSAAFSAFIDSKYIPMEPKVKIFIGVAILLVPVVAFFFLFFKPQLDKYSSLETQKSALVAELEKVKAKARTLPQLEKELEETKLLFEEKSVLLPKDKEIPKLLKDISSLGMNAGLEFLSFKPQPDVPKDFYSEIPISISVRGPYHSMGHFLDTVSKLDRIVTVKDIKMGTPKQDKNEMLLSSDCQLVTYRFTNVELPKAPEKKK